MAEQATDNWSDNQARNECQSPDSISGRHCQYTVKYAADSGNAAVQQHQQYRSQSYQNAPRVEPRSDRMQS